MRRGRDERLVRALRAALAPERVIDDAPGRFAYGTDASFYRLTPAAVVKAAREEDIVDVLRECRRHGTPLTFRAAGTSLSGQAVTEGVLLLVSALRQLRIDAGGTEITLGPGVIGADANAALAPFGRKIGPDPASINAAMVGGIAANNASGMCCGTAENSYKTLRSLRAILADGTVLDTGGAEGRAAFAAARPDIVAALGALAQRVKSDRALAARIERKYAIKNTTGYSLNALVDFDDPIDVLAHLLIGSEGTLACIAEITYATVRELPCKASALVVFPDIEGACRAAQALAALPVAAAELMDRAALRSVERAAGMPPWLQTLPAEAAALLIETRAERDAELSAQVDAIARGLSAVRTLMPPAFTADTAECARLWDIRKGLFPSVGAMRAPGTTVIIEDVVFPLARLGAGTCDLVRVFREHGYADAILFGHALAGNLHFVFTQDFNREEETRRYARLMADVSRLVVEKYDGSLKGEHGTGRNMAPFVALEWGEAAYAVMREIKRILDPECLLNPGVVLNDDPECHLRNLKPLPAAHRAIDACIECGFCEAVCPSRELTLTPRQRIAVAREIARRRAAGADGARELRRAFAYRGEATCATDGLCALRCPVGINTGAFVKELRAEAHGRVARAAANAAARRLGVVSACTRAALNVVDRAHGVLGARVMQSVTTAARVVSARTLPQWNPWIPRGAGVTPVPARAPRAGAIGVVYFPSCISRTFGASRLQEHTDSQAQRTLALLAKAGCDVRYPRNLGNLCCGLPFASKGFFEQAEAKLAELLAALEEASEGGALPVLFDTSPCLYQVRSSEKLPRGLRVYDPAEFVLEHLQERLRFERLPATVAVHATCSARKLGADAALIRLAHLCAEHVIVPAAVGCCGFAGDRGFTHPELNAAALKALKEALPEECRAGYSTSRMCEIGLSLHSGIPYQSIVYLVDACTRARE